ncbi:MAG: hypothetical protein RhofKO_15860 [Rhodothermales bacterium]
MNYHWPRFALVFLLLTSLIACDTQDQQEEFIRSADQVASGFTETTENGEIVSEDTDDWRTAPVYIGSIRIDPAFPNPTAGEFVTIPLTVTLPGSIRGGLRISAIDRNRRLLVLDELIEASDPGAYVFQFSPLNLDAGLKRLFIFDGFGELISYGDLMIE